MDGQCGDVNDIIEGVLGLLRNDDGPAIVHIGSTIEEALTHWSDRSTLRVIVTRERRRHYLERHPEAVIDEATMIEVLLNPYEVHINKQDRRIAIFYAQLPDGFFLRIPVWISDRSDRQNSVLSLRRARAREVEKGRREGRQVWVQR